MALDGVMLACIKNDIKNKLTGANIKKIYQPEKKLLDINLRQPGKDFKLLISTHPQHARVHISNLNFDNPRHPPAFCMLLRKYLTGGIIKDIKQPEFERILNLEIENYNKKFTLIMEIMGRYSNIILIDERNKVLDAIKRITKKISRERVIYPGVEYQFPPSQDKLNPLDLNKEEFFNKIPSDFSGVSFKAILYNFRGIGPYLAREIIFRAGIDYERSYNNLTDKEKENIWLSFKNIFELVKNNSFTPSLGISDNKVGYLSAFYLRHLENNTDSVLEFNSTGELFNYYHKQFIQNRIINKLRKRLTDIINNFMEKNNKKQRELRGKLKSSLQADKYREKGELLKANIYKIEKGMEKIELENYYNNNKKIKINLDPGLTASENIQKLFKKYNKTQKSVKYLKRELGKFRHEERYLEQVLLNIKQSGTEEELLQIEEELIEEGYIKTRNKNKNKNRANKSLPPRKYKSSQGYDILVGRNNHQNDILTKKIANSHDLWLHTKKIAGSHVVIRNHTGSNIPENTIKEAARLAAYYSKGRMSTNVPVDYTEVKNVNKPAGAKPGLVYYDNYQTVYVNPANMED